MFFMLVPPPPRDPGPNYLFYIVRHFYFFLWVPKNAMKMHIKYLERQFIQYFFEKKNVIKTDFIRAVSYLIFTTIILALHMQRHRTKKCVFFVLFYCIKATYIKTLIFVLRFWCEKKYTYPVRIPPMYSVIKEVLSGFLRLLNSMEFVFLFFC